MSYQTGIIESYTNTEEPKSPKDIAGCVEVLAITQQ